MAIKRFIANKDNTISNLFLPNLADRGTAGNTGQSDILELFSIHAQASTSSLEKSRILIDFPISEIETGRSSGDIPASGSVNFIFNLYNTPHNQTTPELIDVDINPILIPWEEGFGLDMETYSDKGKSNWISASSTTPWRTSGGDIPNYLNIPSDSDSVVTNLTSSVQDISVDITDIVEEWLKPLTAADVRINFSDVPTDNTKIKLISTDGTEKIYKFLDGGFPNDLQTGNVSAADATILVDLASAAAIDVATALARLKQAIESSNGHSTKFSVANEANFIVTQTISGKYGNTVITITTPENEAVRVTATKTADNTPATHLDGGTGAPNNGLLVKLAESFEDGSLNRSFYTKKFFARGSQFFFKRPTIEARWNSSKKDDSGKLVKSSSVLTNAQNTQTIYYYNYVGDELVDLPVEPQFTLTTDTNLSQKVTIKNDSNHVIISDPLNIDYTQNAYVDFKINNTSLFDDHGYYQSTIKVSHTDPATSTETCYYFLARPHWSSVIKSNSSFPNKVYSVNSVNTAANRAAAAADLIKDMNNRDGFKDTFVATVSPIPSLNGEGIRIYSRESGGSGRRGKLSLYRYSDTTTSFVSFVDPVAGASNFDEVNNNDASIGVDSTTERTVEEWRTYAADANDQYFGRGWFPSSGVITHLELDAARRSVERSRTFGRDSAGTAEDISSSKVSTGVYKAQFKIASNIAVDTLYEKWWVSQDASGNPLSESEGVIRGFAGSAPLPIKLTNSSRDSVLVTEYIAKITNLKQSYNKDEQVTLRLFVRDKTEDKNMYTKMVSSPQVSYLGSAYYQVRRLADNLVTIPYSTGSLGFTELSYDKQGNYFNLDMSLLEPNYAYEISFLKKTSSGYIELKDKFKFRVD